MTKIVREQHKGQQTEMLPELLVLDNKGTPNFTQLNRFYTNVQMVGDHFLVRGYENGRHFATREKFYPTLFVPSNKKTKYKTLEGDYVESIEPGTVRDCREFIKKYDGVENFKIYGNERYIYQYISEMYPEEEVKFDTTKIKISTIDQT